MRRRYQVLHGPQEKKCLTDELIPSEAQRETLWNEVQVKGSSEDVWRL